MKLIMTAAILCTAFSAMAAKVEIPSSEGTQFNIASIERSIQVDNTNGRITVVETDNGGSTDIASAVAPSELLVTYYKDGEMNNVQATFDLGPIYSLKAAKMINNKTLSIDVDVKTMEMKLVSKKITVDLSDLVKKAANPEITVGEFETQTLDANIISSEKLGF